MLAEIPFKNWWSQMTLRTVEIFSLRTALAFIAILIAFAVGGELEARAEDLGMGSTSPTYRGSSGALYNYDLSNPSDQLRYSVDPGAQLRDSINVDPRIELDRSLRQYGAGVGR
jgi:hypothetical protein